MPNGENWHLYLAIFKTPLFVQSYLENSTNGTGGRIYFEGLMEDTDMSSPPTHKWYKLHLIAITKRVVQWEPDMWPTDVSAWGLNIWESDLIQMERGLMQMFACIRAGEEQSAVYFSSYKLVEGAYECMRPRFQLSSDFLGVDPEWRMKAMHRIVTNCWRNALLALNCGYYDKKDGRSTEKGDVNWQELLDHAAKNDRRYGLDTETVSHKRAMQDDNNERSFKRTKTTPDIASTNE